MKYMAAVGAEFDAAGVKFSVTTAAIDDQFFFGSNGDAIGVLCNVQFCQHMQVVRERSDVDIAGGGNQLHAGAVDKQAQGSTNGGK